MKVSKKPDELTCQIIKNEIEETFGKKISTSRDCMELSGDVLNKISFRINHNTLRRFFGLIRSNYSSSATTLHILSKYCGFSSLDELIQLRKSNKHLIESNGYPESILKYLVSIFINSSPQEYEDKTFSCVVKETILFLLRHPELTNKFQRAISKTKNGQHYYFEHFINIDKLNSFYGEGLLYYLAEKKTSEAQIFGHSFLCIKSWLIENNLKVKDHHNQVIKHDLSKDSPPFLHGCYFATKILYADVYKFPAKQVLIDARLTHRLLRYTKKKDKYPLLPYFECIIGPILFLTGHNEEALYYFNYAKTKYGLHPSNIYDGFYEGMDLFKALIYMKTGRKKEAKELYRHLVVANFNFLTKKSNAILYLILRKQLEGKTVNPYKELRELIDTTGFSRLSYL